MALSMDEQRMLAEIERRLAAEDPGLAAKLSSFRRPGPAAKLRSPRGKILGSLFAVAMVAVVSMMVYAMIPFRAHSPKSGYSPSASSIAAATAPGKAGTVAGTSASAPSATPSAPSGTSGASHVASAPASAKDTTKTGTTTRAAGDKTTVKTSAHVTHAP